MTTPFPSAYYTAFRLFTPEGWGDLLDGPVDSFEHVVTLCYDAFNADPRWITEPTAANFRAGYIEPGKPEQNVTAAVIAAMADRMEALNG